MIRLSFARSINIAFACTVVVLAVTSLAYGRPEGITGRSKIGCNGSLCHSGDGNFDADLQIIPPERVKVGIENSFIVRLTRLLAMPKPNAGGFNLSAENGELIPGENNKLLFGELTHKERTPLDLPPPNQ